MPRVLLAALLALTIVPEKGAVYVTASFLDKNNLFVENLARDEVHVVDNSSGRQIEFMAKDELPVVYGVVFERALIPELEDAGRSRGRTTPAIASARDIAYELIDKHLGRQAVWIGLYDRELKVMLEPSTDGFRAKDTIQRLTGERRRPQSFLYGALFAAVAKMTQRPEKRRVLLLFLDAVDSESAGKAKALRNLLGGSNVELFVVSFASRLAGDSASTPSFISQAFLRDLAQATAGDAFFAADYREHLDDVSRRMYNHIRTLYTFGFLSDATSEKPSRLAIECKRSGVRVRSHPIVVP